MSATITKVFKGLEKNMTQPLKNWIESAGITKHITYHCFRHTFATLQIALTCVSATTGTIRGFCFFIRTEFSLFPDTKSISLKSVEATKFGLLLNLSLEREEEALPKIFIHFNRKFLFNIEFCGIIKISLLIFFSITGMRKN